MSEYLSKEDLARLRVRDSQRATKRAALRETMRQSDCEIEREAVQYAEAGFGIDAIVAMTKLDRRVVSVLVRGTTG